MIRMSRRAAVLTLVAGMLAACGSAPTAPSLASSSGSAASTSASPQASTRVPGQANGISFNRPAAWTLWQPNQSSPMTGGPLIYLSTDPLLPGCATVPGASPNPSIGQGLTCDWPLESLSSNGVLVSWVNLRTLETMPPDGEEISINGDRARLQVNRPGSCAAIGAEETMSILVPIGQPTALSNIAVVACLRGPDLATAEGLVRELLGSTVVTR